LSVADVVATLVALFVVTVAPASAAVVARRIIPDDPTIVPVLMPANDAPYSDDVVPLD
jgi:hypothetical protein